LRFCTLQPCPGVDIILQILMHFQEPIGLKKRHAKMHFKISPVNVP
jgi:hypothetical protein